MYGSLGMLALIAEVAPRVHPLPESSATVVVPASASIAGEATRRLMASPLEPSAVRWIGNVRQESGQLAVRFSGIRAGVVAQTSALADVLALGNPSNS